MWGTSPRNWFGFLQFMINRIVLSYFPSLIFSDKVDGHSSQALYKGQRGSKDAWEWDAVGWWGRPDGMYLREYWTVSSAALCLGETWTPGVFVGWLKPHSCVPACAAMFMQEGLSVLYLHTESYLRCLHLLYLCHLPSLLIMAMNTWK